RVIVDLRHIIQRSVIPGRRSQGGVVCLLPIGKPARVRQAVKQIQPPRHDSVAEGALPRREQRHAVRSLRAGQAACLSRQAMRLRYLRRVSRGSVSLTLMNLGLSSASLNFWSSAVFTLPDRVPAVLAGFSLITRSASASTCASRPWALYSSQFFSFSAGLLPAKVNSSCQTSSLPLRLKCTGRYSGSGAVAEDCTAGVPPEFDDCPAPPNR